MSGFKSPWEIYIINTFKTNSLKIINCLHLYRIGIQELIDNVGNIIYFIDIEFPSIIYLLVILIY